MQKKVSLTVRATEGLMNERNNRWTDQQMDRLLDIGYRVACKRLEKLNILPHFLKMCKPHDTVIFQWQSYISLMIEINRI